MNDQDVLGRAARAVVRGVDYEASFYEAQPAVEDWALDALEAALRGDSGRANALLDRYEHADWEARRAYAFTDRDEQCRPPVRTASIP